MRIALLGMLTNSSGRGDGAARVPAVLHEAGLLRAFAAAHDVLNLGDLALPPPTAARDATSGIIDPSRLGDTALVGPGDVADLADGQVPSLAAMPDLPGPLHFYPGGALHGVDLAGVIARALVQVRAGIAGWWLHTDIDVLSREALPAIDYPMGGGISWPELEAITGVALGERIVAYIARSLARQVA